VRLGKADYALGIGLDEYLDVLAMTRGYLYWQVLFARDLPHDIRKDIASNYAAPMKQALPRLFPGEDFGKLAKIIASF
jgi:hypothetical protein